MRSLFAILFLVFAAAAPGVELYVGQPLVVEHTRWTIFRPSLVEHMLDQVVSRVSVPGKTGKAVGIVDGSNFFQGTPQVTNAFWLLDVTNILARSIGMHHTPYGVVGSGNWATPVSPHITVTCGHTGSTWAGSNAVWILPNGSFYTNLVLRSYTYYSNYTGLDMTVNVMEKTNHTWVKYLPIDTARLYAPSNTSMPVVYFRGGYAPINLTNGWHTPLAWYYPFDQFSTSQTDTYDDLNIYFGVFSGDSGNADFAIIENQALLAGIVSGYWMTSNVVAAMNAAISNLCTAESIPIETVTAFDLSNYRRFR
jgi:hypothetical protein